MPLAAAQGMPVLSCAARTSAPSGGDKPLASVVVMVQVMFQLVRRQRRLRMRQLLSGDRSLGRAGSLLSVSKLDSDIWVVALDAAGLKEAPLSHLQPLHGVPELAEPTFTWDGCDPSAPV